MALWRDDPEEDILFGQGIKLRAPVLEDYDAWAKLRGASLISFRRKCGASPRSMSRVVTSATATSVAVTGRSAPS